MNNDTLHFNELLDISRSTFPQADYGGTWMDGKGLVTLLNLSVMNKDDTRATSWGAGRPEKLARFAAALTHEVDKVKKHFHVIAVELIQAWRCTYAPDTVKSSGQSVPSQDVLSEPKLGQSARYCWEYALINHACLIRVKEAHDKHFAKHPWKVDFDHHLRGSHCMVPPLLLEEVYAVSMLCSPLSKQEGKKQEGKNQEGKKQEGKQQEGEKEEGHDVDQGLTASIRAQQSAGTFFQNGLFNCSFTGHSSIATSPLIFPGAVGKQCPACTNTALTKPRGMGACGHIICDQCVRAAMQKQNHGMHSFFLGHAVGGGSGIEHVACPLCKIKNSTNQVMDMPAVGCWVAQQL